MPAGQAPTENPNDANGNSSTPTTEAVVKTESEFSEDDLKTLENAKTVPYSRFKEVNEKLKMQRDEFDDMKKEFQSHLGQMTLQYEAKLAALNTKKDDYGIEFEEDATTKLQKQIESLSSELTSIKKDQASYSVNSEIKGLEGKYPEADTLAVLGWKQANPRSNISDLMEKSHNENIARVERKIRAMVEEKKKRAGATIPTGNSIGIKLTDAERPKNLRDAAKGMRKFFETTF